MENAISIKGLNLTISGKEIIKNMDIDVNNNELVFIAGRNGSGKSCLFNSIMGRYNANKSLFSTNGSMTYHEQKSVFITDMTIRENLACFNIFFNSKFSKDQLENLITKVGLSEVAHQNATNLSGGEKQRLSLAITLLRDRDIYLFDEAESAMDPSGRKLYFEIIEELKSKGKTVMWISHHIKESLGVADKGYFLSNGEAYMFDVKEVYEIASNFSEDAFATYCEERLVNL